MPRLSKYYQNLQNIKDGLLYKMNLYQEMSYDDLSWIFGMTKQGVWKAIKRYKEKLDKEGINIIERNS